ncbi:MAG: valine--tRNA ligase [Nitrososphaeria archaeon]
MPDLQPAIKERRWNVDRQQKLFRKWRREGIYSFNPRTKKKIFTIDTPPPYPSGKVWHIGAAAHYSEIDMVARAARMMGFKVYFPIGIDRNGLPVELYTERRFGVSIKDTPREKFVQLCIHALDDLEEHLIGIMKTMGLSGDFDHHYRTDSRDYRKLTQATFIKLWHRGLIYEDKRPNNYCVDCGTTIADAEIEYRDLPAELVYVDFGLKGSEEKLTIATTRPELLCSCQAVIVNPGDERYRNLPGKSAVVPIYEREVPIMAHPYAKPEFGTGVVMVCSYGDYSDVQLFRELKLKEIVAVSMDGTMTEAAGLLSGLTVNEARRRMKDELAERGLLAKVESTTHRTPICERSETPIEIVPMPEFYLKQMNFLDEVRGIANRLKFYPEMHRQILLNWIDSISIDWPISRRRYYGTEIPIWYCVSCNSPNLPKPGRYYQPWRQAPPFNKCSRCGSTEGFVGETKTLDTWMDSAISPLYISGYLRDESKFKRLYPNTLRAQGKDIIRTWLYYTLLRCYQLTGKAPFRMAWITGMGLDAQGRAMHRHLRNVIDPVPILEKYGADSFRFWASSEAAVGHDYRCSEERVAAASRFVTKLWNVSRFISAFPKPRTARLTTSDRWILAELSKLVKSCLEGYQTFDFFVPSNRTRDFLWNLFAPHYVELCKNRAYGKAVSKEEQRAAWFTLHTCLKTILLLLAPVMPFVTDEIWSTMYRRRSIHTQLFPKAAWKTSHSRYTQDLTDFNSHVWNVKKNKGVSLRESVEVEVPASLAPFTKDLKTMHNIKGPTG